MHTSYRRVVVSEPNEETPRLNLSFLFVRNGYKDQLVYVLVCPKCGRTLGEWVSTEAREKKLRGFPCKEGQSRTANH